MQPFVDCSTSTCFHIVDQADQTNSPKIGTKRNCKLNRPAGRILVQILSVRTIVEKGSIKPSPTRQSDSIHVVRPVKTVAVPPVRWKHQEIAVAEVGSHIAQHGFNIVSQHDLGGLRLRTMISPATSVGTLHKRHAFTSLRATGTGQTSSGA